MPRSLNKRLNSRIHMYTHTVISLVTDGVYVMHPMYALQFVARTLNQTVIITKRKGKQEHDC